VRARDRFDRATRRNTSGAVDTSMAQVPDEGRHGNKYGDPSSDPYSGVASRRESSEDKFAGLVVGEPQRRTLESVIEGAYERARKSGYTGIYYIVNTAPGHEDGGKSVKGPFKGVDKADAVRKKMGKGFQVINKEYLNPESYQHLESVIEGVELKADLKVIKRAMNRVLSQYQEYGADPQPHPVAMETINLLWGKGMSEKAFDRALNGKFKNEYEAAVKLAKEAIGSFF